MLTDKLEGFKYSLPARGLRSFACVNLNFLFVITTVNNISTPLTVTVFFCTNIYHVKLVNSHFLSLTAINKLCSFF